jgi:hypothetical protein
VQISTRKRQHAWLTASCLIVFSSDIFRKCRNGISSKVAGKLLHQTWRKHNRNLWKTKMFLMRAFCIYSTNFYVAESIFAWCEIVEYEHRLNEIARKNGRKCDQSGLSWVLIDVWQSE